MGCDQSKTSNATKPFPVKAKPTAMLADPLAVTTVLPIVEVPMDDITGTVLLCSAHHPFD